MNKTTLKRGIHPRYPQQRPHTKARSLCFLLAFALICSGEEITLTTTAGRKIEKATIRRVEADGAVLVTDSGIEKIPFAEMSPETQRKLGHDPGPNAVRPATASSATTAGGEITLTTNEGRKIEKATLNRIEPDGLVLTTDAGIEKIHFAELSPDLQRRYGYNPSAAATFSAQVSQAAAQREQDANRIIAAKIDAAHYQAQGDIAAAAQHELARKLALEERRQDTLARASAINVAGEVIQCFDDGLLVDCRTTGKKSARSAVAGIVLIRAATGPLGEQINQLVIPDGFYSYVTADHVPQKVPAFRLSQ